VQPQQQTGGMFQQLQANQTPGGGTAATSIPRMRRPTPVQGGNPNLFQQAIGVQNPQQQQQQAGFYQTDQPPVQQQQPQAFQSFPPANPFRLQNNHRFQPQNNQQLGGMSQQPAQGDMNTFNSSGAQSLQQTGPVIQQPVTMIPTQQRMISTQQPMNRGNRIQLNQSNLQQQQQPQQLQQGGFQQQMLQQPQQIQQQQQQPMQQQGRMIPTQNSRGGGNVTGLMRGGGGNRGGGNAANRGGRNF
jgi:hypothetical protein